MKKVSCKEFNDALRQYNENHVIKAYQRLGQFLINTFDKLHLTLEESCEIFYETDDKKACKKFTKYVGE